jgi:hypothetical protein
MHPADHASHANALWDELRVWDPGDWGGDGGGGREHQGAGPRGERRAHIDPSIATVPAHAHPQISLAGAFLRRFFHCRRWCVP